MSPTLTLAVIPARAGSKGLPRKNLLPLAGKPLIAWTIEAALSSKVLDRVIVSTESREIAAVARRYGADVPFVRPNALARDETPGIDVVLHATEQLPDYKTVVLLQPTSPLRMPGDIIAAIELYRCRTATTCVSVVRSKAHPNWMMSLDSEHRLLPYEPSGVTNRRQELSSLYQLNGSIYVLDRDSIKLHRSIYTDRNVGYVMPPERSFDIDTELDHLICEKLIEARRDRCF